MHITNEQNWQDSIEHFNEFIKSGRLQNEEREYKENLIETIGNALTNESINSAEFISILNTAIHDCNSAACNLTHFSLVDNFYKYLESVSVERLRQLFGYLFDEQITLSERFDKFQNEVDSDYELIVGEKKRFAKLRFNFFSNVINY